MSAALISIVGPPAAGKTTLAERFAGELPARTIYEDYAGNPFLAESYTGSEEFLLPAQMHYLMSRVEQLSRAAWGGDGLLVSDYGFCQDRIYAEAKLGADDLALYRQVAARLEKLVHPPDVLVHLDASVDTLLSRIAARGRAFELAMSRGFLERIRRAYGAVESAVSCDVLRVDCDAVDLRLAEARRELIERIRGSLCG